MHPKEAAYHGLQNNRQKVMEKFDLDWIDHTPPSEGHYPHRYKWDSGFFIEVYTDAAEHFLAESQAYLAGRDGKLSEAKREAKAQGYETMAQDAIRRAVTESFSLFKGQGESGKISNVHFAAGGRQNDPERKRAFAGREGSTYDQPSVTAVPILGLYELMARINQDQPGLIKDRHELFLQDIKRPLERSLKFWNEARTDSRDKLIAVVHPHETGRDSDPTFDKFKHIDSKWRGRIPRNGPATSWIVNKANALIDYDDSIGLSVKVSRAEDDPEKLKEVMWVKDVMMNCIHVDNLRAMAKLAEYANEPEEAKRHRELAEQIEQDIIENMYDPEDKIFYNIDKDDSKLKEVSINNLFPLTLPSLPAEQLEATLDLMERGFKTDYPLPSVATFSPNFDPYNRELHRLWRGPTWINMNAYLTDRGLLMQAEREDLPPELKQRCRDWAERVTISSWRLLEKNGACEFYNPINGEGQRLHVKNFGWSYKALTMRLLQELGLADISLPNENDLVRSA